MVIKLPPWGRLITRPGVGWRPSLQAAGGPRRVARRPFLLSDNHIFYRYDTESFAGRGKRQGGPVVKTASSVEHTEPRAGHRTGSRGGAGETSRLAHSILCFFASFASAFSSFLLAFRSSFSCAFTCLAASRSSALRFFSLAWSSALRFCSFAFSSSFAFFFLSFSACLARSETTNLTLAA